MGFFGNKKKDDQPKAEKSVPAPDLFFTLGDKKYKVLKGATVPFPNGSIVLTAADICVHEEAQQFLVDAGASCIELVEG